MRHVGYKVSSQLFGFGKLLAKVVYCTGQGTNLVGGPYLQPYPEVTRSHLFGGADNFQNGFCKGPGQQKRYPKGGGQQRRHNVDKLLFKYRRGILHWRKGHVYYKCPDYPSLLAYWYPYHHEAAAKPGMGGGHGNILPGHNLFKQAAPPVVVGHHGHLHAVPAAVQSTALPVQKLYAAVVVVYEALQGVLQLFAAQCVNILHKDPGPVPYFPHPLPRVKVLQKNYLEGPQQCQHNDHKQHHAGP